MLLSLSFLVAMETTIISSNIYNLCVCIDLLVHFDSFWYYSYVIVTGRNWKLEECIFGVSISRM